MKLLKALLAYISHNNFIFTYVSHIQKEETALKKAYSEKKKFEEKFYQQTICGKEYKKKEKKNCPTCVYFLTLQTSHSYLQEQKQHFQKY